MTRKEIMRRWKQKMLADPVRLAIYRARTRAHSAERYAKAKKDPALMAHISKVKAAWHRKDYVPVQRKPGRQGEELAAHRRAWQKEWRAKSKGRVAAYNRAWMKAHPEAARRYYESSYEDRQARKKVYYRLDPSKVKARVSAWQKKNPDKVRSYHWKATLAEQIGCSRDQVPQDLISLCMEHWKLKHELRKRK